MTPRSSACAPASVKNMLGITLIAVGVPMIVMGDEVRRTQLGYDNRYCEDNEISRAGSGDPIDRYAEHHRFVRATIDVRPAGHDASNARGCR